MKDDITIGEKYGAAMKIKTRAEADKYFKECVDHFLRCTKEKGMTRRRAKEIERSNLAYFAGYFDTKTRKRVERLFLCAHPVFGKTA